MSIKSKINQLIYFPFGVFQLYRRIYSASQIDFTGKRIFLLNIPSHGNLGDHLLSVAEQQFFKDNFPYYKIELVTSADLYYSIRIALNNVKQDDILCVTGGGFLGSLYVEEKRILKIIKMFPNNKIIILPQTFYYENTSKGQSMLCEAAKHYAKHPHLYVIARDKKSYTLLADTLMKDHIDHIAFTPDMALYLKRCTRKCRKGILWCLRNDGEVNPANEPIIKQLQMDVKDLGIIEKYTDTYVNYSIPLKEEQIEVDKKIEEISHAKVVITDRLHGMIYSVITGTPVIVLDNISGKVEQVYSQWISHVPYIRFITNPLEGRAALIELLNCTSTDYSQNEIISKYQPIINFINAKN